MLECEVCVCERMEEDSGMSCKTGVSKVSNPVRMNHGECWNTLKWDSQFILVLCTAKSTDYIAKTIQTEVAENWISYKKLSKSISLSTPGMELGGSPDFSFLKRYNALDWESKFTLGLNTTKNINYIEKWFKEKLCRIKFPQLVWQMWYTQIVGNY